MATKFKTKKIDDRTWTAIQCNPTIGWECKINDRVSVLTWQFGDIHQCKVHIKYQNDEVGIGLQYGLTERDAMRHCVEWAENYILHGPPSLNEVFKHCFENYPTLFRTRIDVISHIFFVIGNGYDWLDGVIVSNSPEDHIDFEARISLSSEMEKRNASLIKLLESDYLDEKFKNSIQEIVNRDLEREKDRLAPRPFPDDGKLQDFYPVCEYSKIMHVPDDVRPEWLELSYEAAIVLRDRSDPKGEFASNIGIGAQVAAELEKRFPQLKKLNDSITK